MFEPMFLVQVDEDVSASLLAAEKGLEKHITILSEKWAKKIRDCVYAQYIKGTSGGLGWEDISPGWRAWKAAHGQSSMILQATGQLSNDIVNMDQHIHVRHIGGNLHEISFGNAFAESGYVEYHEHGRGKNPKRDFFQEALEEALKDIHMDVGGAALAAKETIDKPKAVGVPSNRYQMGTGFIIPPVLVWILPLGKLYLFMGMSADIHGLMAGSFTQPGAVEGFLKAWLVGSILFTKKTIRRRFRRELWR